MESKHTPDHIHNPSCPCGCTIVHMGKTEHIRYCARHAASPDLLAALHGILACIDVDIDTASMLKAEEMVKNGSDGKSCLDQARKAIAKAEER